MPGNAGPTKTLTACSGSTSPSGAAWRASPRTTANESRGRSTAGHANASAIEPRRNAMRDELQCCSSKLISGASRRDISVAHFPNTGMDPHTSRREGEEWEGEDRERNHYPESGHSESRDPVRTDD